MMKIILFVERNVGITVLIFLFFCTGLFFLSSYAEASHFMYLADSLVRGHLWLNDLPGRQVIYNDLSFYNGHYYLPFGPVPALLYLPIIWMTNNFDIWSWQVYSGLVINMVNILLIYKLARTFKLSENQALWLIFAYTFATAFVAIFIFPWNSYLSHKLVTTFILGALLEYQTHRRYFFIGVLMSLALGTRLTAGLGIILFIALIFFNNIHRLKESGRYLKRQLLALLTPYLFMIIILGWYNYVRFGDPSESGYTYQFYVQQLRLQQDFTFFGFKYIWVNFYNSFLRAPRLVFNQSGRWLFPFLGVDGYGLSVFFTSPFFIYLFRGRYPWGLPSFSLLISLFIYLFLLLLGLDGWLQFGYRYSLDFLPYLLVALMFIMGSGQIKMDRWFKTLVLLGAIFNLYICLFGLLGMDKYFS